MTSPAPGDTAQSTSTMASSRLTMDRTRFIRFMVTGGAAAVINLVSRYLLNFVISFASAVAIAYLCGMVTAYVLGRLFVFERSGRRVTDEFSRFTAVNLIAAAQVWLISVGLGEYVFPISGFGWHPLGVAHLIGVAVPVFTSYVGHRRFSFAPIPSGPTASCDEGSLPERPGRST